MQEKFRPTIKYFPEIVEVSSRLFRAARILDIPVIVTEQYPKGEWIEESKFTQYCVGIDLDF